MTKKDWFLVLVLVSIAAFLRLHHLPARMTFSWDQERDITAVTEMIKTRRPKLIGPVVRGEGGFMLGPLYYYILLPAVLLMKGNPLSLGLTSVGLDLLTLIYLYFFTKKYFSSRTAVLAAITWALSPFITNLSLTSWNVSLIPLFILAVSHLSFLILKNQSPLAPYLLVFLAGLAFHIHPSLFLLIPLLIIFVLRKNFFSSQINWLYLVLAGFLPLLPLLVFDLRHQFINWYLFLKFVHTSPTSKPESYPFVIQEILHKLSLYLSATFLSQPHLLLGIIVFTLALVYSFLSRSKPFFKLCLFYFSYLLFSLILYRNPFFPEYYLNPLLIPSVILFAVFLSKIPFPYLISLLLTTHYLLQISFSPSPTSLAVKQAVVQRLSQISPHIDLRYELKPGENFGFNYLLDYYHCQLNQNSPYKAVLQSSSSPPSYIDKAKHLSTDYFGIYKLSIFVVE